MRPWIVGLIVALAAFATVVAGSYALQEYTAARGSTPTPPCPSGWTPTHDDRSCALEAQVCHTTMAGAYDGPLSCPATSPGGSGWLRVNVAGNGGVAVSIRDGAGNTVLSRNVAFTEGLLPDISVKGRSGSWTLSTEYHAQGSATIILWG